MWFRLGPVGDLRSIPPVERDQSVDVDSDAPVAEHVTLTGARSQDRMGVVRSTWVLPWPYLTPAEVREVDAMRRGLLGGPLWLIDPLEPNVAPAAVATVGTERKGGDGWTAESGSRGWARATVPPPAGVDNVGVMQWSRSTIADTLSTGRSTVEQRVPLLPEGGPVSAASMVRLTTGSPIQVRFGIDLWDAADTRTTSLAPVVTLPAGQTTYVELAHTVTPPSTAVTWAPVWTVAAGQPASTVQVRAVSMGYGSTPPPYSLGGGAARVFIRALSTTYDDDETITAKLTVVES